MYPYVYPLIFFTTKNLYKSANYIVSKDDPGHQIKPLIFQPKIRFFLF